MASRKLEKMYRDPAACAERAGLCYGSDSDPGFRRVRSGRGFRYVDKNGKTLKDPRVKKRIQALAIPPAWQEVWIAGDPKSHLQATGTDQKGIKQYLYHEDWREFREALKFARLVLFGERLPRLRRRLRKHLRERGVSREKVLSAVLTLIDDLSLRVGNAAYAEANKTYGITTLENRHARVTKDTITFRFVGKSHRKQEMSVTDPVLARAVKKASLLPGTKLFQYVDEESRHHPLTSDEVNSFLKKNMDEDFTAKDFRTWTGTREAYAHMRKHFGGDLSASGRKKALTDLVKEVAETLGNTPAVCRAHYIDTELQRLFEAGKLEEIMVRTSRSKRPSGFPADEAELIVVLRHLSVEKVKKLS
jgi:DNA topoisomerase-1